MKCVVCSKDFIPKNKIHIYCTTKCRNRRRVVLPERKELMKLWRRRSTLKTVYGISFEQYDELLKKQGGGCAVCGKVSEKSGKALAVDHDHKTGEIFGVLCTHCNRYVIGRIRNPQLFFRAAEYLSKGTGWFVPPKSKRRRRKK